MSVPNAPPAANSSGTGRKAELPVELKGDNVGAWALWFIWWLPHRAWWQALCGFVIVVPAVAVAVGLEVRSWVISIPGFIVAAWFSKRGNEWAWRNRKWESIDHFRRVQRIWTYWGVAFFIISLVFVFWDLTTENSQPSTPATSEVAPSDSQ
jgi:hypothetical protein